MARRKPESVKVAHRLAEQRAAAEVTIKELSAKTGISMLALHRKFASRGSRFTIDEAADVAEALGLAPWMAFVDARGLADSAERLLPRGPSKG